MTKRKYLLPVIALLLSCSMVFALDFDLRRAGSRVYVSTAGDISLEAISGKSITVAAGTKKAVFDLTNISNATTRTINVPNANSTTVQANTGASNQFLTAVSAQGVVSRSQPAFSDLSGAATAAQLPTAVNSFTFATGKTVVLTDADSLTVGGVIVPQTISITLCCLGAASASGDAVFVGNRAYQVTAVRAVWSHVGGSSAAATVEKLTSTTAPGSGTAILTSAFDLTTTANTVGSGSLSGTVGNLQLAAGDRLGVKLSGTLTALTGLNITIQLKAI